MYRLIMWDLDGTLADTSVGVVNAVKYTEEKLHLSPLKHEEYYKFIGPPNSQSYRMFYSISGELLRDAIRYHKEYAVEKGVFEARLYQGIKELVCSVKNNGIHQVVTTLKLQESAEKVLEQLGIASYMDMIIGSSQDSKDKRQLLRKGIESFKCFSRECVLVGDSIYDQKAAFEERIDFIAVLYGFGFQSAEEVMKYPFKKIAGNVTELTKFFYE